MPTVTSYLTSVSTLAGGTGTWATVTVAQLNSDNAAYAVWTKPSGTGQTSPGVEASGFDTTGVPSGSTVNSVLVEINQFVSNTGRQAAFTYELWDGTTAQIGATQTGTNTATTSNVDSFSFTGVTYAQLATLRVRDYGHGGGTSTSGTSSVDYIRITVDYTPPVLDSPALELSTFGTFTGVGSGDTINHVTVAIVHKETAGASAPTFQLWDASTAQIGATQTGTTGTTDHTDSFDFTGVTYSQLATLRVRFFGHAPTTLVESVDSVALTVNYTAAAGLSASPADPVGVTDSATRVVAADRSQPDPVGVTDAAAVQVAADRTQADPVGVTDSVSASIAGGGTVTQNDPVGATDTATPTQAFNRTQTDPVGISDALALAQTRTVADPVGVTDAVQVEHAVTLTDAVGVTDTGTDQTIDFGVDLADTVGATDTATPNLVGGGGSLTATPSDPVGVTDAASVQVNAQRSQADPVGVTDSVAINFAGAGTVNLNDPVGVTDVLTSSLAADRPLSNPVGVTDVAATALSAQKTQADPVGVTDSITALVGREVTPADPIGVTDTVTTLTAATRALTDPVGLLDTLALLQASQRPTADPVGVTDSVTITFVGTNDGTPVRNPRLTLTVPASTLTLTVPTSDLVLTVPASILEMT